MKYKGLRAIAAKIVMDAREHGTVATTVQMMNRWDLGEQQMHQVKRYGKKFAADRGFVWAYDPDVRGFLACPDDDKGTCDRQLGYAYRQWGLEGGANRDLIAGAHAQGFLNDNDHAHAEAVTVSLETAIFELAESWEFND